MPKKRLVSKFKAKDATWVSPKRRMKKPPAHHKSLAPEEFGITSYVPEQLKLDIKQLN